MDQNGSKWVKWIKMEQKSFSNEPIRIELIKIDQNCMKNGQMPDEIDKKRIKFGSNSLKNTHI